MRIQAVSIGVKAFTDYGAFSFILRFYCFALIGIHANNNKKVQIIKRQRQQKQQQLRKEHFK